MSHALYSGFYCFCTGKKAGARSWLVGFALYFHSQFSCQLVSTIINATSKCINPESKLESPPKQLTTFFSFSITTSTL